MKGGQTGTRGQMGPHNPEVAVVLVDMDGVLADFDSQFIRIWKERYPERPQLDQNARTSPHIVEEFPEAFRDDIESIFREPGFYLGLPEVSGAVRGINAMRSVGLDVWICSSPLRHYRHCVPEKFAWVEEHLGGDWTTRIVLARNKGLIRGTFLIDDHSSIVGERCATWELLLFDTVYNRGCSDRRRITWETWWAVIVGDRNQ